MTDKNKCAQTRTKKQLTNKLNSYSITFGKICLIILALLIPIPIGYAMYNVIGLLVIPLLVLVCLGMYMHRMYVKNQMICGCEIRDWSFMDRLYGCVIWTAICVVIAYLFCKGETSESVLVALVLLVLIGVVLFLRGSPNYASITDEYESGLCDVCHKYYDHLHGSWYYNICSECRRKHYDAMREEGITRTE